MDEIIEVSTVLMLLALGGNVLENGSSKTSIALVVGIIVLVALGCGLELLT